MEKGIQTGEVEEILAEMEQLAEVPDDIMESDEDYQIVISGWRVYIPELGLNLHEGSFAIMTKGRRRLSARLCSYRRERGRTGRGRMDLL